MESIGEKLKTAREEKGYSADQVARDTNIARRFILAMEQEDFSAFPGDTYLLGFLRNYGDYLGLDSERLINLYRNMQIQEQPVPMDELIQGRRRNPSVGMLIGIALAVVILGGGGYGAYLWLSHGSGGTETAAEQQNPELQQEADTADDRYEMGEEIVERRFQEGQTLRLVLNGERIDITVAEIGEQVSLTTPTGATSAALGEELLLDLTQDDRNDVSIKVQDIDTQGGTAVLRFDRGLGRTAEVESEEIPSAENQLEATAVSDTGTATVESRTQSPVTILTAEEPESFRIDVSFRGYSLVRYSKDGEGREQRYFNENDSFRLEVDREVMLWISNAGSFQAKIAGEEINFGDPGEVATKLLRWQRDAETDRYELRMLPVY
ncbi:MAG: helix-turn-helix domain-containing protein [Spirochaetia bacterium]